MNEEEIWQKIRAVAADYANRGEPLFRGNYYSLWVATAGNEIIAIRKDRADATSISPIENDGGRITTFTTTKVFPNLFGRRNHKTWSFFFGKWT